ncbi:hypothetical protein PR202_ga20992 [Eleusine coracana subsp. coracana]|uniref:Uncharacterized protein n=1 Tax=Eleusine coracana subsp. coracana TaxID=191504 RepID=A0AAV5CZZ2_ELECO|nr:hypothetical protein QOZ80_8AG0631070 [Eleusine coracana subsp. coracana]GJN03537.1 hypothetical protein PR202_ga20992 [Eleusine coracana subsp. coracana]
MSSEIAEHSSQEKLIAVLANEQETLRRIPWGNTGKVMELLKSVSAELSDPGIANGASDAKKWVQQVTEIRRDVEDMLDESRSSSSSRTVLSTTLLESMFGVLRSRRRMAKQVKNINSRIDAMKLRLSLLVNLDDRESPANSTRYRIDDRQLDTLSFEEVEALGVDSYRKEIRVRLLDKAPELKVISVVGIAGIGKTTLVRSVYNEPTVRGRFSCHAWITCGAASSAADLLKRIVLQVFLERPPELPASADPMELAAMVGRYLRDKPYLVVLDDIWSSDVWDHLSVALADNGLGSRIIVSSRVLGIGSQCWWVSAKSRETFTHRLLEPEDSLRLFLRKAFPSTETMMLCPPADPELKMIALKIVRECHGLPLLLVTLGGLMSTKEPSVRVWNDVLDQMHKTKDLQLTLPVVLWLAYNDLPSRLKACFLYFVLFPRTYCAKRTALIRLWIAEGFINKEDGKTLEETAEEYLMELIQRNLVHVTEYYDYGKVKSCGVHDMLREIIILKSEEENFGTPPITGDVTKLLGANVRRLSTVDAKEDLFHDIIKATNVRTLFMLGANSVSASSLLAFISEFKLLRVLDLEGAPVDRLPEELPDGLYLRYLSLRNTRVSDLPKSVKKLTHLQTLDLKGTDVSNLPSGITKLENIRHLLAYRYYTGRHPPYYYALGVTLPQGIGLLTKLQKLTYVEATRHNGTLVELGKLTQLKRLGIVKLKTGDGPCLCSSIAKMAELLSLSAASISIDEPLDLSVIDPAPQRLERLYLRGHLLNLPGWIFSLRSLARIRFRWSRLSQESIKELQSLPVIELALIQAYDGTTLHFTEGFNRLQILEIDHLTNLEHMSLGAAMRNIQKMSIRSCEKLSTIPDGVEGLKSLKEIHLFAMPEVLVSSIKEGGPNQEKVQHVPFIRVYNEHRDISSINL